MAWQTPENLKYTQNDEWFDPETGRFDPETGRSGITDYAQDQLSDVVYVEFLVDVGDEVQKGDSVATVESVKAAADVYAPVSGKVVEINTDLTDNPEWVNEDPYGKAWMIRLEPTNPEEMNELMDAEAYAQYCEERE